MMADPKSPSKVHPRDHRHHQIYINQYRRWISVMAIAYRWYIGTDDGMSWFVGVIRFTDLDVEMWTNYNGGGKSADRISNISHPTIKWCSQIAVYPGVVAYRWRRRSLPHRLIIRSFIFELLWLLEKRRYMVLRMKILHIPVNSFKLMVLKK